MTYKVKSGDNLSKIAKANRLTLAQLLDANPKLKANPNKLNVGDVLNIPNGQTAAPSPPPPQPTPTPVVPPQPQPQPTPAPAPQTDGAAFELGKLSAKYETGDKGPGVVSTGKGDLGGVSYGCYQMSSTMGTVGRFVTQADFQFRDDFKGLKPGSPPFSAKWKAIAAAQPDAFRRCQHDFIKRLLFDPLVAKVLKEDGLDVTTRSHAVQDVVWSTAVQHGGNTSMIHKAIAARGLSLNDPDFDRKFIRAVYAERGRKKANGSLVYFSSSSAAVQKGVANRFASEERDALKMLSDEA
jgi:murein DD-endopeptidase MepM/ murein hydrolase activator NlpD